MINAHQFAVFLYLSPEYISRISNLQYKAKRLGTLIMRIGLIAALGVLNLLVLVGVGHAK